MAKRTPWNKGLRIKRSIFICQTCKKEFEIRNCYLKRGYGNKYCSYECYRALSRIERTCLNCGKKFTAKRSEVEKKSGGKFCKRECYDKWRLDNKIKRFVDQQGYIRILRPKHPRANKEGYIYEQVEVCEKIINRHLNKSELPHHCNFKRNDNRPENLYLFPSKSEHSSYHRNFENGKVNILKSNLNNMVCTL